VNSDIVANIDIAPTIFDATNIEPRYTVDGQPLPVGPYGSRTRSWILTENPTAARTPNGSIDIPVWSSYVSKSRQYIEWRTGKGKRFVEDYNLNTDPWELHASNHSDRRITRKLKKARDCAGTRQCP
jgi:arylsulfatase A-like enzyme